jgi:hypothetical protein
VVVAATKAGNKRLPARDAAHFEDVIYDATVEKNAIAYSENHKHGKKGYDVIDIADGLKDIKHTIIDLRKQK